MGGFSPLSAMEGCAETHFMYFLGGQSLRIRPPVKPVAADSIQTLLLAHPPASSLLLSGITKKKYHIGPFNSLFQGIKWAIAQVCLIPKTTPTS